MWRVYQQSRKWSTRRTLITTRRHSTSLASTERLLWNTNRRRPLYTAQPAADALSDDVVNRQLFETLLACHRFRPTATTTARLQTTRKPWLDFFASLGQSTVLHPSTRIDEAWAETENLIQEEAVVENVPAANGSAVLTQNQLLVDLAASILRKDLARAMNVYQRVREQDLLVSKDSLNHLLYLAFRQRSPIDAYHLLQHYRNVVDQVDLHIYHDMCQAIRHLDPLRHDPDDIQFVARSLVADIQKMDEEAQTRLYPLVLSALLGQKSAKLSEFPRLLYQEMKDKGIKLSNGYLEHLLVSCKYNRVDELPFPDILRTMVDNQRRPFPYTAVSLLEMLFPYTDQDATTTVLKVIMELQAAKNVEYEGEYMIDISTLEMISAAAATKNNNELNLSVWDALDVLGLEPTESIYESTVAIFSSHSSTYSNAFAVVAEMEKHGFVLGRPLIRTISTRLRPRGNNLNAAFEELKLLREKTTDGSMIILNAIMSAAAERGDIERILALLEVFPRYTLLPNADSFSFAFEALGKNLVRRKSRPHSPELKVACVEHANMFLDMMDEHQIEPSEHILREYVEFLCQVDEVETATKVIRDSIDRGLKVNGKALLRVIQAQMELQQFDMARTIAGWSTQGLPFVEDMIARTERKTQFDGWGESE